jgi:hypothetical protein
LSQIKVTARRQDDPRFVHVTLEDSMQLGELYFLILVCGSFGLMALGLAATSIRDYRWQRTLAKSARTTSPASFSRPKG